MLHMSQVQRTCDTVVMSLSSQPPGNWHVAVFNTSTTQGLQNKCIKITSNMLPDCCTQCSLSPARLYGVHSVHCHQPDCMVYTVFTVTSQTVWCTQCSLSPARLHGVHSAHCHQPDCMVYSVHCHQPDCMVYTVLTVTSQTA